MPHGADSNDGVTHRIRGRDHRRHADAAIAQAMAGKQHGVTGGRRRSGGQPDVAMDLFARARRRHRLVGGSGHDDPRRI